MSRPVIIGFIGAAIVAAAIALTFFIEREPDRARVAQAPPAVVAATDDAGTPAPAKQNPESPGLKAPSIAGLPIRPKFDVVRVNPTGDTVIAGRAAPNAEVTVTDQDREVGKVKADSRGEWVLVPEKSLTSGPHELSLAARKNKDEPDLLSREKVILVVPERGKDIAGREITGRTSGTLAIAVPRDGSGGTTVLQKPGISTRPGEKPGPKVVKRTAEEMTTAARELAARRQSAEAKPPPPVETQVASGNSGERRSASRLTMDAIDYDQSGKVEMSGRAPKGSRVQLYLDNKPLGEAIAQDGGVWRVKPSVPVSPGIYKMRVDQIDTAGKVVARVELPFARAKPLGALPHDSVVLVQPGTNLWRIARKTYGRGLRYAVIYEANRDQIRNPDLIYPGQIFFLPKVN